jgi:hypothetical protein
MGAATQDSSRSLGCSSLDLHHILLHATLSHAWPSAPMGASLQHIAIQTADTQFAAISNRLQGKRNIGKPQKPHMFATVVSLQHHKAYSS